MKAKVSIVHIVIITLIVAILTAIIVPIIVNGKNSSAASISDESAVDLLNEALIADEDTNGKPATLCEVWAILEEAGYNSEAAPLYSGNAFYYYSTANRVILTTNNKIVYPAAYASGILFSNLPGSAFIELSTLETDEYAHDSAYKTDGVCGVCGAVNPN